MQDLQNGKPELKYLRFFILCNFYSFDMNSLTLILLHLSFLFFSPGSEKSENLINGGHSLNLLTSDSISTIEIGKGSGIYFTYPVHAVKIIMQPCDSLDPQDDWFCPEPVYSRIWRVGEWKGSDDHTGCTIYFSPGPSADPEFIFVDKNEKRLGSIQALKLRLNIDLSIYSSGHTNNMFDKKRMFSVQKDTVIEVKQPFYQVGLSGILLRNIVMFTDDTFDQVQQTINEGEEIEIMFALPACKDEPYERKYLVRTELGILGYIRIENEDTFGGLMEGFFYAGD